MRTATTNPKDINHIGIQVINLYQSDRSPIHCHPCDHVVCTSGISLNYLDVREIRAEELQMTRVVTVAVSPTPSPVGDTGNCIFWLACANM